MKTMNEKKSEAVAAQLAAMAAATTPFERYWAGSATASLIHHYQAGAVVTVRAKRKKSRALAASLLRQ